MRTIFPPSFYVAVIILAIMAGIMVSTIDDDSITTDEAPHLTAGYTYLAFRDFRINPEHPPLIKDIAAFPLLFQDLNFPKESPAWTTNTNDQWALAPQFLFESGNNPDTMIWWGRIGPIILTLLLGLFLFLWARKLFGLGLAALTLMFFAFSPTFLAHGRLVTTDVAAAVAFFIGIWATVWFLQHQTKRNFFITAAILAVAQLLKFSAILLWPYIVLVMLLWIVVNDRPLSLVSFHFIKRLLRYGALFSAVFAMTLIFIFPAYQFHVQNYPPERQIQDIRTILPGENITSVREALVWTADKPVLRAYGQYFLGVSMVFLRVGGGNTTYLDGKVTNTSWKQYFPVVFALKTPGAFLALIALALAIVTKRGWDKFRFVAGISDPALGRVRRLGRTLREIIANNFAEVAIALFVAIYWYVSIMGNLNIGVRHVLPTFPLIYLLIAGQINRWLMTAWSRIPRNPLLFVGAVLSSLVKKWAKGLVLALLMIWYMASSLAAYPHHLAYFNEFAGGPSGGHRYVVDSNLDWGQDLKRLARYVRENNIEKIKLFYFGGSKPEFYLGNRFQPYYPDMGPTDGWFAISATLLKEGQAQAVRGYTGSTTHFEWLLAYEPITVIGHSIFVFYIPPSE